MPEQKKRSKVALLVNIIAPYRVPIYRRISEVFDTHIFVSGREQNRDTWTNMEAKLPDAKVKQSWGMTLRLFKGKKGKVYDYRFIHLNPGYFWDLIRTNPDAVITNEMGFRSLAALLYGTLFRKPVWVWWGGTLLTERHVRPIKRFIRSLFRLWVKRWISYGQTSSEYLHSIGVRPENILQIQNCVEEEKYLDKVEPAFTSDLPIFLHVGQLIRRKGVDTFLEAAARVQQEGYTFTLLFVGGGPEKDELMRLAEELQLTNIHFYPNQKPEVMPSFYQSADYLVFPTLEDVWGLVANEALWSGTPVLCSKYAGCAKEIFPAENIFDPLNQADFVQILKRALDGQIQPADISPLKTNRQISELIIADIEAKRFGKKPQVATPY